MKTILETAARKAGATEVIYDREAMQNILLDEKKRGDVICLIDEFDESEFILNSNGIDDAVMIKIAFISQVNFEEVANMNYGLLKSLRTYSKSFVANLIKTGLIKGLKTIPVNKFQEPQSDFNAIGWSMTFKAIDLYGYVQC